MDHRTDVLIVGTGITALALAWRLRRGGYRVFLAGDSDRAGGVVESHRDGGWLLEQGPNSYSSFGAEEEAFLEDLGIADRALRRPIKTTDRYIFHSGRLHAVPTGPGQLLTASVLSAGAKARLLAGAFKKYPAPPESATLGGFFRGMIGDEAVETLLKPAVAGIYAADADRIGLDATFPKLARGIRSSSRLVSALKAMRRESGPRDPNAPPKTLTSFREGLEELPRALGNILEQDKDAEIRLNCRVTLRRGSGARWRLEWDGEAAEADHAVVCTPAPAAASLLRGHAPEAATIARGVEHAPLTVVHAGLAQEDLTGPWNGFGFLSRRGEGVRILGSIWSSAIFPGRAPDKHRLLTCFYGGDIDPEVTEWSDSQLEEQLTVDLRATMGFRGNGYQLLRIRRWKPALPIFRPGHEEEMQKLKSNLPPGLHAASNWTGGVSVPDRIRHGWQIAESISAELSHPSEAVSTTA